MTKFYSGPPPSLSGNIQYQELAKLYDATYESLCAEYFLGENSIFQLWLKEYKQYLIEYQIYSFESSENQEIEILGLTNYVSTVSLRAVTDYMEKCLSIFSFRNYSPKFK